MPVYNSIAEFHDDMSTWRRDIHAHPELGFEEIRTGGIVAEKLEQWGIEVHTGIAKTGVVGVLRGTGDSTRTIGLRADLDALPMTEVGTPDYRSTHDGKMHACGHDGHTTMLLGAARYLAETRNFDGTVNFIFQPAEENAGGGGLMVDEGLFERFPCDAVYGMHNYVGIDKGKFGIRTGALMAAVDSAKINITGVGGHAAWPNLCVDPIAIGVQLHTALQTIISRNTKPQDSAVLSITQFHGGSANNVISGTAMLDISIRSLRDEVRDMLRRRIFEVCDGVAKTHGATIEVDYQVGYPATVNHRAETENAIRAASAVVGAQNVDGDTEPVMGSEDFSYMLEACPGAYILIGQRDAGNVHSLHSASYDFNDDILPLGASYWSALVEQSLPRGD